MLATLQGLPVISSLARSQEKETQAGAFQLLLIQLLLSLSFLFSTTLPFFPSSSQLLFFSHFFSTTPCSNLFFSPLTYYTYLYLASYHNTPWHIYKNARKFTTLEQNSSRVKQLHQKSRTSKYQVFHRWTSNHPPYQLWFFSSFLTNYSLHSFSLFSMPASFPLHFSLLFIFISQVQECALIINQGLQNLKGNVK